MAVSSLGFQSFSTVNSDWQQTPVTIASADTIAPVTFLTILTGTTTINTIVPPVNACHMLAFLPVDGVVFLNTGGNMAYAYDMDGQRLAFLVYNPITRKYYANSPLD